MGHVESRILLPLRGSKEAVVYTGLLFKKVGAININLEVIRIYIVYKAIWMGEITKGQFIFRIT